MAAISIAMNTSTAMQCIYSCRPPHDSKILKKFSGADLNLEERCPCGLGHFRVYFPLGNYLHFIQPSLYVYTKTDDFSPFKTFLGV